MKVVGHDDEDVDGWGQLPRVPQPLLPKNLAGHAQLYVCDSANESGHSKDVLTLKRADCDKDCAVGVRRRLQSRLTSS
jgi:hypothetical protein